MLCHGILHLAGLDHGPRCSISPNQPSTDHPLARPDPKTQKRRPERTDGVLHRKHDSRTTGSRGTRRDGSWPRRTAVTRIQGALLAVAHGGDPTGLDTQIDQILGRGLGTTLAKGQVYSAVPRSSQWPSMTILTCGYLRSTSTLRVRTCLASGSGPSCQRQIDHLGQFGIGLAEHLAQLTLFFRRWRSCSSQLASVPSPGPAPFLAQPTPSAETINSTRNTLRTLPLIFSS